MSLVSLIILGLLPSFIWLLFYLRRDQHPESNKMVLTVFLWGMLIAPIALILELIISAPFSDSLQKDPDMFNQPLLIAIFLTAITPALVEEFLKYQVVGQKVLKSSHFDEPLDVMLYMVIAGLGFAAVENLSQAIALFSDGKSSINILGVLLGRFAGATLLHTLSCGIFGFFIAYALKIGRSKRLWYSLGFVIACLIHFCYNGMLLWISRVGAQSNLAYRQDGFFSDLMLSGVFYYVVALILFLVIVAGVNVALFNYLKKQPSICNIKS